eukprot:37500-Pelagomonas_calceolata.AAC.1
MHIEHTARLVQQENYPCQGGCVNFFPALASYARVALVGPAQLGSCNLQPNSSSSSHFLHARRRGPQQGCRLSTSEPQTLGMSSIGTSGVHRHAEEREDSK